MARRPPSPPAATRPPRAARRRRSARLGAALAALIALASVQAAPATAAEERFLGQVTDALRNPATKLAAGSSGRVVGDLVFLDREQAGTAYRACIRRRPPRGGRAIRTCFKATSGQAGVATVTPLRFQRGRYAVSWRSGGAVVARWRFAVV